MGKAERYYLQGIESQKAQDFLGAYNSFALAAQTNPDKEVYKKAFENIRPLMMKQKGSLKLTEAKRASELRMTEEMLAAAAEALKLDPTLTEAQIFWAKAVIELKIEEDFRNAKERLLRAKASLSKNPEPCFLLAKLLYLTNDKRSAKRELEEALKRDPRHPGAKKLLEEI